MLDYFSFIVIYVTSLMLLGAYAKVRDMYDRWYRSSSADLWDSVIIVVLANLCYATHSFLRLNI